MRKTFSLTEDDKALVIEHRDAPYENLKLRIDYDDVDHARILKQACRLLKVMNANAAELTK